MSVLKMVPKHVEKVRKLQRKLETTRSGRKGARQSLTNLRNRAGELLDYLDDYVVPTLKTTRKAQCSALVKRVRNLL